MTFCPLKQATNHQTEAPLFWRRTLTSVIFLLSGGDLSGRGHVLERLSSFRARSAEPPSPTESSASRRAELEGLEGSAQAALARLAEEKKVRTCARFLFFIKPHPLSSCCMTVCYCAPSEAVATATEQRRRGERRPPPGDHPDEPAGARWGGAVC